MSTAFTELAERSRSGDRGAASEWIAGRFRRIRDLAHLRLPAATPLRAEMDSEDLAQEAALRAFARIEDFAGSTESSFFAWIVKIIDSVCADRARAAGALKRGGGVRREPEADAFLARLDWHGATPSEQAMGAELLAQYRSALRRLPSHEALAIVLRRHCDCTFAELAAELGQQTEAQARSLLSRALARISPLLVEPGANRD